MQAIPRNDVFPATTWLAGTDIEDNPELLAIAKKIPELEEKPRCFEVEGSFIDVSIRIWRVFKNV